VRHWPGGPIATRSAIKLACLFLIRPDRDTLAWVRIVVTEVTGQGSIRRGVLDTAWHSDPGRCTALIRQADLGAPPPYRPEVGRPVYEICVDDKIVWVAWRDVTGPLRELVTMTILTDQPRPGLAAAGGRRQLAQPVPGEQAGQDAPHEPAGAQPGQMPARSSDQPEPGDRGAEATPVPRRDRPTPAESPDDPVQGVRSLRSSDRAQLPAHFRDWVGVSA
jgi:hypothetical protein